MGLEQLRNGDIGVEEGGVDAVLGIEQEQLIGLGLADAELDRGLIGGAAGPLDAIAVCDVEINDLIGAGREAEKISTPTASEGVIAITAIEAVAIEPTKKLIITGVTLDQISTSLSMELIISGATSEAISTDAAADGVLTTAAIEVISTGSTTQPISARQSPQGVIPAFPSEDVVGSAANDAIGAGGADQQREAIELGCADRRLGIGITARGGLRGWGWCC